MATPRIIHRIWLGPPMPPEFAGYGDRWAEMHPGWEHRLWGEEAADLLEPRVRLLYDRAPEATPARYVPRFRSNLLRYAILAELGGVYVDCDLAPLRPLDDLPGLDDHRAWAGWERQDVWIGNTILAAEPGHPFYAALLAGAPQSVFTNVGRPSPMSTGPQYLTHTWRRGHTEDVHVYDERTFYPRSWRDLSAPVDLDSAFTDHQWCALRGQVTVVIPYRGDGAHRDRHLARIVDHYATHHPEYQVLVEHDDGAVGPHFNKGRLATRGASRALGDVLVVADGDLWVDPDRLRTAVAMVHRDGGWVIPYNEVRRLSADATEDVYAGAEPTLDSPLDRPAYAGVPGGGLWVIRRSDYLDLGGMDPRFAGWGGEDDVWGWWADAFLRRHVRLPGPVWHLWHPQAPNPRLNLDLWRAYQAARHNPAALRALRPNPQLSPSTSTAPRHMPNPRPPRDGTSTGGRGRAVLVGRPAPLSRISGRQ